MDRGILADNRRREDPGVYPAGSSPRVARRAAVVGFDATARRSPASVRDGLAEKAGAERETVMFGWLIGASSDVEADEHDYVDDMRDWISDLQGGEEWLEYADDEDILDFVADQYDGGIDQFIADS